MTTHQYTGTNLNEIASSLSAMFPTLNKAKVFRSIIDDILAETRPENCSDQTEKAEITLEALADVFDELERLHESAQAALGRPVLREAAE